MTEDNHILNLINGLDIYLLDQLMKGNISKSDKIIDAGCGGGRNLKVLRKLGYQVDGFDRNAGLIENLQASETDCKLTVSSLEDYSTPDKYDVVVCNAVLHFAESHTHFDKMFKALVNSMVDGGLLFIRMTSNFATANKFDRNENGIAQLRDGSSRYLIDEAKLTQVINQYSLKLKEPIKTVNVGELRCMSNLVFSN